MADAGAVPPDERGTTAAERGTSPAPVRNAPPSDAGLPATSTRDDASAGAPYTPTLADGFAEELEKQKVSFADAERASYDRPASNVSPEAAARVKAIADGVRDQVLTDLANLTAEGIVRAATNLANRWIATTLERLGDGAVMKSDCVRAALETHFAAKSDEEIATAAQDIVAMLTELRDGDLGINSPAVTYECGGWCWGNPAKTGNFRSPKTVLCDTLWPSVFEDYRRTPKDYGSLATVLIHEGLHRTSWWRFKHSLGEAYVGTEEYTGLDLRGHQSEADSYAYCAKAIAACDGV